MSDSLLSFVSSSLQLSPRAGGDTAGVGALLASMLDADVTGLQPLGGGSTSRTYTFSAEGEPLVAKVNADADVVARAVRTLEALRVLGLPVPRVVASTLSPEAGGALVMTTLTGRDLGLQLPSMSRAQMTAVATRVTEIQRTVSTLPSGQGCGFVGIGEPATRSWLDVVRHPSAAPVADPLPDDTIELVARLNATIDLAGDELSAVTAVCFLDDITTKNVMVDKGVLTGIVDCDLVCHGDPLLHLGLTSASVHYQFPAECHFYVDELVRLRSLSGSEAARLALYEAVFLVQFLTCAWADDGDWRVRAAQLANECLDRAERAYAG